jgi:hypothetical protein
MGTTWVAQALSRAKGVTFVNEPDNEWPNPFALKAKLPLGQYPVLAEGDSGPRDYERLWERAFSGCQTRSVAGAAMRRMHKGPPTTLALWRALCDHANPRLSPWLRLLTWVARPPSSRDAGEQVLVKAVHAPLALEWVASRFRPKVLVVLRHPLNVIASWTDLGWGDCALETSPKVKERFPDRWRLPELGAPASRLRRVAWEIGLFTTALHAGLERHPNWLSVSHEALCIDPEEGFRQLFHEVGLTWTGAAASYLQESNQPGTGYRPFRIAAEQPESWRRRLTGDQITEIWSVLSRIEAPWVERVAGDFK